MPLIQVVGCESYFLFSKGEKSKWWEILESVPFVGAGDAVTHQQAGEGPGAHRPAAG